MSAGHPTGTTFFITIFSASVVHNIGANQVLYTGWPKKNATLSINNFKKTRDRMKKVVYIIAYKIL